MASCWKEKDACVVNSVDVDEDLESTPLSEFVRCYNVPQTVAVTQPLTHTTISGETLSFQTGDVLLLRVVITSSVTLSYYDPDTAYTRDVHLPVNFPGRFEVLNGKYDRSPTSEQPGPDSPQLDNAYENYEGKMYPRVDDLLRDCPPYFKCTESFVDPIDAEISFNGGDRFRFVSIIDDMSGRKFLECKHMSGKLLRLSSYCRGLFQALQDKCFYTLSDLVSIAAVPRRLRLARDSLNGMYPIPGLDKDYAGYLHMHKPIKVVKVSPWGRLEITWSIPTDLNLQVKHYVVDEYEMPVSHFDSNRYTLAQFRIAYEDNFPVSACIQSYTDKPSDFSKYIPQRSPVVCVHKYDKVERILATCDEQHYVLSPTLKAKCVPVAKTFKCVSELLRTQPGTKVAIKESIACDIPSPFSLKQGDVLSISSRTSFTVVSVDYKWNNSSHQVNVLKCDKISDKGQQRIKIPLDLEVSMEEILDNGRDLSVPFETLLLSKPEFPVTIEFIEPDPRWTCLPRFLTLSSTIREPCLLVSNRPQRDRHKDPSERSALLEIPERHLVLMSFESLLHPDEQKLRNPFVVRQDVEPVSSLLFTEMEESDKAYETIAGRNIPLPKKIPYAFKNSKRKTPRSRPKSLVSLAALSKSLPSLNALRNQKKQKDVINTAPQLDIVHLDAPTVQDENLYEDVEINPGQTVLASEQISVKKNTEKEKRLARRSFFKKKSAPPE